MDGFILMIWPGFMEWLGCVQCVYDLLDSLSKHLYYDLLGLIQYNYRETTYNIVQSDRGMYCHGNTSVYHTAD